MADYARRWKEIEPRLPESVRRLDAYLRRHSFHDLVVKEIERIDSKTIHIVFDHLRLELLGVASASLPSLDGPDFWLYAEFDLTESGLFVLWVLLNDGELSVTCRDVRLHSLKERRFLILDEAKPPGPTLFLDRRRRR